MDESPLSSRGYSCSSTYLYYLDFTYTPPSTCQVHVYIYWGRYLLLPISIPFSALFTELANRSTYVSCFEPREETIWTWLRLLACSWEGWALICGTRRCIRFAHASRGNYSVSPRLCIPLLLCPVSLTKSQAVSTRLVLNLPFSFSAGARWHYEIRARGVQESERSLLRQSCINFGRDPLARTEKKGRIISMRGFKLLRLLATRWKNWLRAFLLVSS